MRVGMATRYALIESGNHGNIDEGMLDMRVSLKSPTNLPALLDVGETMNIANIPADIRGLPGLLKDYLKEIELPTWVAVTIETTENLDESLIPGLQAGRHRQRV